VAGVCAWPSIVNVTVPVGVPVPALGVTVAVNVTRWLKLEPSGAGELSVDVVGVVVAAALTVWVKGGEKLPWKLPVGE
jgi:hypothetical protein